MIVKLKRGRNSSKIHNIYVYDKYNFSKETNNISLIYFFHIELKIVGFYDIHFDNSNKISYPCQNVKIIKTYILISLFHHLQHSTPMKQ